MKFLLDMPISPYLADWLINQGHDAVHANSRELSRATDRELLNLAVAEDRILITADTDFPQLLAISSEPRPGIILFHGGDYRREEMVELLYKVLQEVSEDLLAKSICVVDRKRIRRRELPII